MHALLPVGSIVMWGGQKTNIPAGWLYCDGSIYEQADYATLFATIGHSFGGSGQANYDSTTQFYVPDFRGYFARGVDDGAGRDPDAADRADMQNGTQVGGLVGSVQPDVYASHVHLVKFTMEGTGTQVCGNMADSGDDVGLWIANDDNDWGGPQPTLASGGNETRAKNAYVYFIIKAQ